MQVKNRIRKNDQMKEELEQCDAEGAEKNEEFQRGSQEKRKPCFQAISKELFLQRRL